MAIETKKRRADGERTHSAILDVAVGLASVEGIGAITIGRLAEEAGVSKSGLFAHFGSKSRLQAEILAAAREIFQKEVIDPALQAPVGRRRLEALCASYLSYVERRVFPGGCFFAGMLAEFDARSGTALHQEVMADQLEWIELVESLIREAKALGELSPEVDVALMTFELTAALGQANYYSMLFPDADFTEAGSHAVDATISSAVS